MNQHFESPTQSLGSVVVTGASSGIGRSIAIRLANDGWSVTLVGRSQARLDEAVDEITSSGRVAQAFAGDVADRAMHRQALEAALKLAPLRGWMNCAGVTIPNGLTDLSEEATMTMVNANQLGTLWGCEAAVSHMISEGTPGSIVNMSSVHGTHAYPQHTVYEMTKAAICALSRSIAVTYAAQGIRANTVAPGAIRTPALDASFATASNPAAAEAHLASRSPINRIAEPEEVASVVSFLLSKDSSYVSGQTIAIDGGWTSALGGESASTDAHRRVVAS